MQEEPKRSLLPLVHTLIGLTIMFSGHFLPCPAMVVETSDKLLAESKSFLCGLAFTQVMI